MYESVENVKNGLAEQRYIASDEIATVVYLAEKLSKPDDIQARYLYRGSGPERARVRRRG